MTEIRILFFLAIGLIASTAVAQSPVTADAAPESSVATAVEQARQDLAGKAREVRARLERAFGKSFKDQIDQALSALEKDGRSVDEQIKAIDLVLAWAVELEGSLRDAKEKNIVGARDRVVAGYTSLASDKANESERYIERAKATDDAEFKNRYQQLADTCTHMARPII